MSRPLEYVKLRGSEVVQWKGYAHDRWDRTGSTRLDLVGDPPSYIAISDRGEHICLTLDGIAFKYYTAPEVPDAD